ncbi:MAG: aminopeptidase P family protein [Anaerolineae bacterium]|nr:aminopeptidase P family protein [Anaerolineae bacterium]
MDNQRITKLRTEAGQKGLDCVALVPGANLFYLTGLSFHLSERPVLALFPVDDAPAIVLPALEAPKLEHAACALHPFPYTDEEGPALAFQQACASLELADARIGAEHLHMRLLEARYLERYAPGCELSPADDVMSALRMTKDAGELAAMREAVAVIEAALQATLDRLEPGMREREVAGTLMIEIFDKGGDGLAFEPIVVAGPNAASPHSGPSDRPIGRGETIVIDCGATVDGYASDITRTVAIGEMPEAMQRVYRTVLDANTAGRAAARPGVTAEAVDQAARAVIEAAGYGAYFIHRTGHGLGLETHEPPYIVAGNRRVLEEGMTFTVEPGIYLPGLGGVRIEDDVVVTAAGAESLTTFPRELTVL